MIADMEPTPWDRIDDAKGARAARHQQANGRDNTDRAPLRVRTAAELLAMQIPRREMLLAPWLPEKGLAMIYSPRGLGKTWLAMAASYAVAAGSRFLSFSAPASRRVLFVDGEMPLVSIKNMAFPISQHVKAKRRLSRS
jgi:hypothetical protein